MRLLKTHFFTPILDFEKSTEYDWVSDQTWKPEPQAEVQKVNKRGRGKSKPAPAQIEQEEEEEDDDEDPYRLSH